MNCIWVCFISINFSCLKYSSWQPKLVDSKVISLEDEFSLYLFTLHAALHSIPYIHVFSWEGVQILFYMACLVSMEPKWKFLDEPVRGAELELLKVLHYGGSLRVIITKSVVTVDF